jgi:hypothetical protein
MQLAPRHEDTKVRKENNFNDFFPWHNFVTCWVWSKKTFRWKVNI